MKKMKLALLICVIFGFKLSVSATSLSVGINCPSTAYSGSTVSCTITSNVSAGMINGINVNYSFSQASYQGFTASGGWSIYNSSSNGFALGNINGSSGGTIGTLSVLVNASSGSSATVTIGNIGASDMDYNDVSASNVSDTISVIEKPIPTTTTRKKVVYLSSLSIDGYDIGFNKSTFNYTLDVGYEVSSLKINASSDNNYTVSGAGTVHINEGENTILVTVTDSNNESSTYTIKVNRVVKVSNIVNNNIDEMTNAYKSNNDLIVNLDKSKDELVVKREMLDLIKGNKRTITYNVLEDGNVIYSFIFDGKEFTDSYNDIDLTLDFNNTKSDIIEKSLSDKKLIYFNSKYIGFYPTGTKLKIKNITDYHQETRMRLYKLNSENSLELIKSNIKIDDKFMEFDIEKGATYILSSKNTNSKNTNIIIVVASIIIFLEIIIVGFLIMRRKKQVELPKLNAYLENPDFIDENDNSI